MLLFINPITTKKRRKVGTIESPTNATISLVRSLEPIILLCLSKISFTKFLKMRKTSKIKRMMFTLMRPKTITLVAVGILLPIFEMWLSMYVRINMAAATAIIIYLSRLRLLYSSVDISCSVIGLEKSREYAVRSKQ